MAEEPCGDGDGRFYLPGGEEVDPDVLTETLHFLEEIHTELDTIGSQPDPPISSVGKYFEDRFQQFLALEPDPAVRELKVGLYDWFVLWEQADTAVERLQDQSVKSWAEYTEYDREGRDSDPILVGGFSSLVRYLEGRVGDQVDIRVNERVETVTWGPEGVEVRTVAGEVFRGKLAILSLPLGVLKQSHKEMFLPPLPSYKVEVIEKLGFGVMDKIFLEFERSFWNLENPGVQLVERRTGKKEEEMMRTGEEEDVLVSWVREIPGFDCVSGRTRTLCGWVVGQAALCMETLTEEQVGAACHARLRQFLGDSLPPLLHCRVTRWGSDPLYRGSYSYRPPACDALGIGPWTLAEPVKGRLLFSGEATDKSHYGTVTGAMQAGLREADRVIQLLASR